MDSNNDHKYYALLQSSPLFQLSLNSRELFHSNFLYWIWQFSHEMFKDLVDGLYKRINKPSPTELWPNNYKVMREHKKFDLCVTSGENKQEKIHLVIENKFKSIPYGEQLDEYYDKSESDKHLLLSLVGREFIDYDAIKDKWDVVSYEDLSCVLSEIIYDKGGYEIELIRDYIKFISSFNYLAKEWLENKEGFNLRNKNCEALRIDDVYQKILFSRILDRFKKELNDRNGRNDSIIFSRKYVFDKDVKFFPRKNTVYINSGLTNKTGFLEAKVKIANDIALLIQIQGEQYRRCVELNNKNSLKDNLTWLRFRSNDNIKQFFVFESETKPKYSYPAALGKESPFRKYVERKKDKEKDEELKNLQNGFCKYGNSFIYQYISIKNQSISEIIDAVISDIEKFRSLIS